MNITCGLLPPPFPYRLLGVENLKYEKICRKYVGNLKKHERNMKKYAENMKKYEGTMRLDFSEEGCRFDQKR